MKRKKDSEEKEPEVIEVDLTELDEESQHLEGWVDTDPFKRELAKEYGAKAVALGLVIIFGATVLLVVLGGVVAVWKASTPAEAGEYAAALGPLLESLGHFSTAVFAPLLAFVLGYYFGERRDQQP